MILLPALPPRHQKQIRYELPRFSDFVKHPELIDRSKYSSIYIDDVNLFKENFDLFLKMISANCFENFSCHDYEGLKFIENELKNQVNITLGLVDDFQNKDRSYINIDEFEKTELVIPIAYSSWNVHSSNDIPIACYYSNLGHYSPFGIIGFSKISKEFLPKLNEIISEINSNWDNYTELDKLILISNYLQDRVQYVDENNSSEGKKGIYITDSNGIDVNLNVHNPEVTLLQRFGVCEGIANATTLLLNNPIINVNVRSVYGSSHVWNVVEIDGNFYQVDNTWAITRNESQYPESLKAKDFTSDYLLLGSKKMTELGHHNAATILPQLSADDYPREMIKERQKVLSKQVRFHDYSQPVFKSYLKVNN